MIRARSVALLLVTLALSSCTYRTFVLEDPPRRDGGPLAVDAEVARDASLGPDAATEWREPVGRCETAAPVDLLFVIDDSASMTEEQASLAAQLPAMITLLVDPPDDDGDGSPDWPAIDSLHVGVVTSDMGSGGHSVPTCGGGAFGARFGDDGLLQIRGDVSRPGCSATYPAIFEFDGGDDPAAFAADVACVAQVGTGGCGFEQQLEATLKALAPSAPQPYTLETYDPPIFFDTTLGHGDREHAGFVREGSLLALVVVTDEEDCSIADPELLDPSSARFAGTSLGLRCFTYPDTLHPIERYVDGLLALRAHRPDLLALAVIAGIPVDAAVPLPRRADYEAILARPDMVERVDPEGTDVLVASCDVPGVGRAFPPRRLVRTAMGIGFGRTTVQSICQADLTPAITPIASLIGRRACQTRTLD